MSPVVRTLSDAALVARPALLMEPSANRVVKAMVAADRPGQIHRPAKSVVKLVAGARNSRRRGWVESRETVPFHLIA